MQVINATLSKRDTIVLMPTGGGKSLVYMLPALVQRGFTLVVSPLISLMHDQVTQLRTLGVRAELLCQHTDKETVKQIHDNLCSPDSDLKLLYVTPERIVKSKTLISRMEKADKQRLLQRIVVDEAHCISQWGHDWRQDYTKLGFFKKQFPEIPVMALTATATKPVEEDIKRSLNMMHCESFRNSVDRPNLQYEVEHKPSSAEEANQAIYGAIQTRFKGQPGIVYCFSKKEAEMTAQYLQDKGIKAKFYHADMDLYGVDAGGNSGRMEVYAEWSDGRVQVVVATIAFGMGINKLDVRFVIHHTMSKSVSAYYQEAGRAGRDGMPATCLLFYKPSDLVRQSTMAVGNQLHAAVEQVYELVKYCEAMLEVPSGSADDMHLLGREKIAENFDERLGLRQRAEVDVRGEEVEEDRVDMTSSAKLVLNILARMAYFDKNLTLLGLADLWKGTGRKESWGLPSETAPKSWKKPDCERMLVHMLLEGILKQKFQFTAYAVNSYMEAGLKGKAILSGSASFLVSSKWTPAGNSKCKENGGQQSDKSKKASKRPRRRVEDSEEDRAGDGGPLESREKCLAGALGPNLFSPCRAGSRGACIPRVNHAPNSDLALKSCTSL